MDNLYFLDFETGGLKSYIHGVCSVAVKRYGKFNSKNFTFYPQKKVYEVGAFNINGFNIESLTQDGVSRDYFIKYLGTLAELEGKQGYLIFCGWNVGFDIDFLLNIYKDKKQKLPCPIVAYDLKEVASKFIKKKDKRKKEDTGIENYKLTTVYQHLFTDFEESLAHTAEYDCLMVERLYDKFKELGYIGSEIYY